MLGSYVPSGSASGNEMRAANVARPTLVIKVVARTETLRLSPRLVLRLRFPLGYFVEEGL